MFKSDYHAIFNSNHDNKTDVILKIKKEYVIRISFKLSKIFEEIIALIQAFSLNLNL